MKRAVVVNAVRTPVARASADKGYFRDVRSEELSAGLMNALIDRVGIDPKLIEDVRWGCVQQQGEQGFDLARIAALAAGLPIETGGVTINRNCASSLQAINDAALSAIGGCEDVQIAGGVEHMDHIPMSKDYSPSPLLLRKYSEAVMQMGLTAEYLAMKYRIPRGAQDEFALRSHQLAAAATELGEFKREVVPTWGRSESGEKTELVIDQCIRKDTSLEALAGLPPAFNPAGGSVTAGNSSPVNVGAAALLIMSEDKAKELGLAPMAYIKAMAVAGVDPAEMGIGPVPAVHKVLETRRAPARPDRVHRAQRSVRGTGLGCPQALEYGSRPRKYARRSDRHRPSARRKRRADRHDAFAQDARQGGEVRSRDDVRRSRTRRGDDLRVVRKYPLSRGSVAIGPKTPGSWRTP